MANLQIKNIENENQKYCLISFISNESLKKLEFENWEKHVVKGVKFHDITSTEQEAETIAKNLRNKEMIHDIYIGSVGKLLSWDDFEKVENYNYNEEGLNELMKGKKEQEEKAKLLKQQEEREQCEAKNNDRLEQVKNRLRKIQMEKEIKNFEDNQQNKMLEEDEFYDIISKKTEQLLDKNNLLEDKDYLTENDPIEGKNFVLFTYIPAKKIKIKGDKNCNSLISIFCCTNDEKESYEKVKTLRKLNPLIPIYMAELGKWIPLDDTCAINADPVKLGNELNSLVKDYIFALNDANNKYEERTAEEKRKIREHAQQQKQQLEENTFNEENVNDGMNYVNEDEIEDVEKIFEKLEE